ncbi:uncharacterized protein ATC70_012541 [Mucor velutinosus]|uniref:Uncharacterized protein n=1 Tax=Mucor velutinosus TaxID=708070 RepID=A0AAN7HXJ7_9FUNG|nr:hypothetical protein ATC70_012541 [Mucor velutinosus]
MSGHEPSPLIPIEKKKFLCVEYPGYVKKPERAIKTLGGESALSEALSNNWQVQLRYRAKDIFSHPINGDVLDSCKLLVKVTRRVKRSKKTGEVVEDDSPWQHQVVGTVEKTVRFRALADFQYIVPKDDKIRQLKTAISGGDVETIMNYKIPVDDDDFENLRNIPPPVFTTVETPFNYSYKQNASVVRVRVRQPDGSFSIKLINRNKYQALETTSIQYEDENVPSKSWHNLKPPVADLEIEAIQATKDLFEERPIWSRFAIKNKLDVKYHKLIKKALAHVAYTFQNGAWRDAWIKYGLDPRKDPKYYIYQLVDIRRFVKEGSQRKIMSRRANPNAIRTRGSHVQSNVEPDQHLFDGIRKPGSSSVYQFCDITDPDIMPLFQNPDHRKEYTTKYSGFLYNCVFERLRKNLKKKYAELLDKGVAQRIHNIDAGLAEEIAKEIASQKDNNGDEQGYEVDVEEDDNMLTDADVRKAATYAIHAVNNGEGSSKRLQEFADEYIDQLESANKSLANDLEDIDLDMIDTFEEFDDDDDFNELEDEEPMTSNSQRTEDMDGDVEMKE